MANSKASELKKKFVTGATPNEADYHELIELANVGRKAVGASEGEDEPTAGEGLNYDLKDGKLSVKLKEKSGLAVSDMGLEVKPGVGVQLDANAVNLAIKEQSALCTEGGALHIKAGNGVMEQGGQLTLNVNESRGLSTDGGKLQVNFEPETSGLKLDKCRLAVKYDEEYFTAGEKGLTLQQDHIQRLASEFRNVLDKAKIGTNIGFRDNVNSDPSDLEGRIATELRNAYRQGSNPVEALKALTGFFKEFRKENKSKLKGGIALSPRSGNTCLYGDNGKKFNKNCLHIVDPYTGQSQQADHEELSKFKTGIYGVYGATNDDGNPGKDGLDDRNRRWTQNALMVLVGQDNFAAVLGSWDMAASADARWEGDEGQFSCIPTTDPKQYQTGYADGYTKPTELARIIEEGIEHLEKERLGTALDGVDVDDSLSKPERWKVVAKQIWTRWLKPMDPPAPPGEVLVIKYPEPHIILLSTGAAGQVGGGTTDETVVAVQPHGKGVKLVPTAIGTARVTLARETSLVGGRALVHSPPVSFAVEVQHSTVTVQSLGVTVYHRGTGHGRALRPAVSGERYTYCTGATTAEAHTTPWTMVEYSIYLKHGPGNGTDPPVVELSTAEFPGYSSRLARRPIRWEIQQAERGAANRVFIARVTVEVTPTTPSDGRTRERTPAGTIILSVDGARWPVKIVDP
ncbi:hypothetical protein [Mycetohabitans rhizoxinica]|uniref:hypothetical protein n=1 Tax=Mycetohabitans rhizoxinica TaxID=412963 RepID=UPI0030D18322